MELSYGKHKFSVKETDILCVSISGSTSFGWETASSDLDIVVIYSPELGRMISPFYKHSNKQNIDNCIDIRYYPIDNALKLLVNGNGNMLDNIFQPTLFKDTNDLLSLRYVVSNNLHKGFIDHCIGYSYSVAKDLTNETRIAKYGYHKLFLERYRELLKGKLLCEGKIEYNLPKLLNTYSTKYGNFILYKLLNGEPLTKTQITKAIEETNRLHVELQQLRDSSNLSDKDKSNLMPELDRWIKEKYFSRLY